MADVAQVKINVGKMLEMNAPEADIDGYLAEVGVTPEQLRAHTPSEIEPTSRAEDILPLDPEIVDRGMLWPIGYDKEGDASLALPQWITEPLKGAMTIGAAAQGKPTSVEDLSGAAMAAITPASRSLGATKQLSRVRTGGEVKKQAGKLYDEIESSDVELTPEGYFNMVAGLADKLDAQGYSQGMHPKVSAAMKEFERHIGKSIPIKRMMVLKRLLKDAKTPDEQRVANIALSHIDESMQRLGQGGATGDVAPVLSKLATADSLYSKGSKAQMFERAVEKAKHAKSGFENSLRGNFIGILNKHIEGKIRLTDEELKAVKLVADGSVPTNVLRKISKFGPGIGQQTNGLMMALLGMSGGGAMMAGNPAVAAGVAGLATVGQGAGMAATRATAKAAQEASKAAVGSAPMKGAYSGSVPQALGRLGTGTLLEQAIQPQPRGILYDERGPLL